MNAKNVIELEDRNFDEEFASLQLTEEDDIGGFSFTQKKLHRVDVANALKLQDTGTVVDLQRPETRSVGGSGCCVIM